MLEGWMLSPDKETRIEDFYSRKGTVLTMHGFPC